MKSQKIAILGHFQNIVLWKAPKIAALLKHVKNLKYVLTMNTYEIDRELVLRAVF